MYKYKLIRKFNSNCHIFEFDPNKFRLDVTIGSPNKLERLSKIKGEPTKDEYVLAKMNGGFFAMNGSREYLGSYVDEGKYYSKSAHYYPTLIFWKKGNQFTIEHDSDQSRHAYYQRFAHFAIGVPWTLVVNGVIDFTYSKQELIKVFGHPYTKQPRSLIGQKSDGTIVWVVIDGRRTNSKGATIIESANLMLELGCHIAVNLDGGGSSEMIVNNAIVNKPSDGAERSIGTAFMCYGKKQKGHETHRKGKVTATLLNVRKFPSANNKTSKILGQLKLNSDVYITGETGNWWEIVYGDNTAYVSKSWIKLV